MLEPADQLRASSENARVQFRIGVGQPRGEELVVIADSERSIRQSDQVEVEIVPEQDRRIRGGVQPSRIGHVRVPPLEAVLWRENRERVESGAEARTTPGARLPGRTKALRSRSPGWSRSPEREAMSPGGDRRPLPDIALPRSHRARVSRRSILFRGAAPTRRRFLADAAPHRDRSPLVVRRATDHG